MDNFNFIGYRIDIPTSPSFSREWDLCDDVRIYVKNQLETNQFVDFPEYNWLYWMSADKNIGCSILAMEIDGIQSEYRCPISRDELWEDLHYGTFDTPQTYMEDIAKLEQTSVFTIIKKKYTDAMIKYGIFMGLG